MLPLISVIIPIYNVEKYLDKCIQSILNQTYKNLEIILVDDGSPDNCGERCDEYSIKDSRVKVIHKKNGGLSDARNAGIEVANGQYLTFVDSDDIITLNMCEILVKNAIVSNSDITTCKQFETYDADFSYDIEGSYKRETFSNTEAIKKHLNGELFYISTCGRLYKRNLFSGIGFPINRKAEDLFTTYKLLYAAQKISYVDFIGYIYCRREDSIMGSVDTKLTVDVFDAICEEKEFITLKIPELQQDIDRIYSKCLLKTYAFFSRQQLVNTEDGKKYREKVKQLIKSSKDLKLSLNLRILINIFNIYPNLMVLIVRKLKKDR